MYLPFNHSRVFFLLDFWFVYIWVCILEHPKRKQLWNASFMTENSFPAVKYNDFMMNQETLKEMLKTLETFGFALVSEVPATIEASASCAERVCFIQETFFGRQWTFTADLARGDTAYTNIALGAHTDTTYLEIPAGIQVQIKLLYACLNVAPNRRKPVDAGIPLLVPPWGWWLHTSRRRLQRVRASFVAKTSLPSSCSAKRESNTNTGNQEFSSRVWTPS